MTKILLILNTIWSFIKKYWWMFLVGIIVVLGCICAGQCTTNQKLKDKYEISLGNEKALMGRIEGNQKDIVAYQTTIQTLQHTSDSTIQHLLAVQQKLKIKNKELDGMLSLATQYVKHDTITFKDTVFKEPDFHIDTCLADQWRTICLELKYPNIICAESQMRSQKEVYITTVKETVNPPKKCAIARWFQKKHRVVRVRIEEDNPNIESEQNVYIQVIGK